MTQQYSRRSGLGLESEQGYSVLLTQALHQHKGSDAMAEAERVE